MKIITPDTDDLRNSIRELHGNGTKQREIRSILHISTERLQRISAEMGLVWMRPKRRNPIPSSGPPGQQTKYAPEVFARMAEMHAGGLSVNKIAAEMKMSRNAVAGLISRNRDIFPERGSPIIRNATPKPPNPPPVEYWMRTLPALPSLIGHVPLAPMAPWLEAA